MLNTGSISDLIAARKRAQLYRSRTVYSSKTICFHTNDYLGLSQHPKLKNAAFSAMEKYGIGSTGSNLLSGYKYNSRKLEEKLAEFLGFPAVLCFSNGYMANMASIFCLCKYLNFDHIFSDRLNHASIIDGLKLSDKKFLRFPHIDYKKVEESIKKHTNSSILCITEGLFGVDGDVADLNCIVKMLKSEKDLLYVDDAHGIGVLGEKGQGLLETGKIPFQKNVILMGTFSKALGSYGAFVAATKEIIEFLVQFAKPYIYSTALPPLLTEVNLAALQIMQEEYWRRHYINDLIRYFKKLRAETNLNWLPSNTHIQLLITKDPKNTLLWHSKLLSQGIILAPLRPPTVPVGSCRLRINLTVQHSTKDLDYLFEKLFCLQKHFPIE